MMRRPETTPCPGEVSLTQRHPRDSIYSFGDDSTANIEFTTDIRPRSTNGAPRHRQTGIGLGPKRRTTGIGFSIHEDEEVKDFPAPEKRRLSTMKSSVLSQPAHRPKSRVSFAPSEAQELVEKPKPSRTTNLLQSSIAEEAQDIKKPVKVTMGPAIKKPARRGTIYIPSEDTTVPSIFMGVFSPIKNPPPTGQPSSLDSASELTGLEARVALKKAPRKSLVAAPARRAPLNTLANAAEANTLSLDIPGQNTGKENVPTGWHQHDKLSKIVEDEKDLFNLSVPKEPLHSSISSAKLVPGRRRSSILPPQNTNRASTTTTLTRRQPLRASILPNIAENSVRPVHRQSMAAPSLPGSLFDGSRSASRSLVTKPIHRREISRMDRSIGAAPRPPRPERVPEKVLVPRIEQLNISQQYPLIQEDIQDPSLYEDNWLAHQEIAITQLVNNLFAASQGLEVNHDAATMRSDFLRIYQTSEMSLLQKRLQGGLMYGALSIPKDVLSKGSRLFEDLGMKRKFLDLWMNTYNVKALRAATETIFGRQCISTSQSSSDSYRRSSGGDSCKSPKRSLAKFLETFLLRNDDAVSDGTEGWAYRRTVLRSLLLILLLDQARTQPGSLFKSCLFLHKSEFKSSESILKALAKLLLPFAGDVIRPLSHLGYFIQHVQYPLEEYDYRIENLAVDLRDGVRLTRLVEILLYPSASRLLLTSDGEATTTIAMPTGEILSLTDGQHDWPLSQHLKFPCLSRATKLFNMQVALSALSGVKGMGIIDTNDIKVDELVDGFREKTVALLWALVSKWGLGSLIDWKDVQLETQRLERLLTSQIDMDEQVEDDDDQLTQEGQRAMLKRWASSIASHNGLKVSNLTTSFADGKVFDAIINQYLPYLKSKSSQLESNASLTQKLASIGCSSQFGNIFSDGRITNGRIFDRDFSFASLAFLCSRLLPASKRIRAAIMIQRNYRSLLQRRLTQKKVVAAKVAKECAMVVMTRERLIWAKHTILKQWRVYKDRVRLQPVERVAQPTSGGTDVGDESDIWLSL